MSFLNKRIEINVLTLVVIVIITGVVSAHVAQTDFGVQTIPEVIAVIGLTLAGYGIWMFLGLLQQLYGEKSKGD